MPNNLTVELPDMAGGLTSPAAGRDMAAMIPMRGITVLAVEDSRFASEALRLMCRRLGARLRRAESIAAARSHLRLYRPNLVIVDLGLPDGRGEALIAELAARGAAGPVVLAMSGDPAGRDTALAAGAAGFLDKPLESFAAFQQVLSRYLPDQSLTGVAFDTPLHPDHLALRDDFARAAALIDAAITVAAQSDAPPPDAANEAYLAGFLTGVARHAHDAALAEAAQSAAPLSSRMSQLRQLLRRRLDEPDGAFGDGIT